MWVGFFLPFFITMSLKIKIKKLHKDAIIPTYANPGDAGMDITAISKKHDEHGNIVYGTGLAFEIPEGYVCLMFPRSSNSKKDLILSNSVGVLDSGYRGEIFFKFKPLLTEDNFIVKGNVNKIRLSEGWSEYEFEQDYILFNYDEDKEYQIGDRIGQIIILPYPKIVFEEVEKLSDSVRGDKGWGSTGK